MRLLFLLSLYGSSPSFAAGESEIKERGKKVLFPSSPFFCIMCYCGRGLLLQRERRIGVTLQPSLLSLSRTDRPRRGGMYKCIITEFNWRTLSSPLYHCEIAERRKEFRGSPSPHRYYWASLRRRQGTTFGEEYYYFFCSLSLSLLLHFPFSRESRGEVT